MNESIIRSPKWLRKFADFEIHTGEDIKGKISKRDIRKKEKEKVDKLNSEWKRKWESKDTDLFKNFYEETFPKEYRGCIISGDLDDIYKRYFGNFDLWYKFDEWNNKRMQKEKEQEEFKKEIDKICDNLVEDCVKNRYKDKVSTPTGDRIEYRFENGDFLIMENNTITFKDKTHTTKITVGLFYKIKFRSVFSSIVDQINKGQTKQRPSGYRPNKSNTSSSSYSSHPRAGLYDTLKDTIKNREEQLSKMSKTDPERVGLENELNNAKNRVKEMNTKYKFEGIKKFWEYDLIK